MKVLVRFITRNAAGGVQENERQLDTDIVTIGRATDQLLQLHDRRARLEHAQIERDDSGFKITTSVLAGVTVNGRTQRSCVLNAGDKIEVGANILTVIEPPAGFDLALTFELHKDAESSDLVSNWTTIEPSLFGMGKRKLSWLLVATVAVLALALPALMGSGSWWLAGPLHSAHTGIAQECGSCHLNPFERVPDVACVECHKVSRHSAGDAVLGTIRCASCHLEHNEPPQLVNQHQDLCADCHSNLADSASLQDASDFLDHHPDFKVTLLQPTVVSGATEWREEHVAIAAAKGAEQSNLLFDHKVHLNEDGIVAPGGKRVIECSECHVAETGGARMQAISMDQHCSGCHSLAFDPDEPTRTVPHGDAEAVVQSLIEYYSARLLGDDSDAGQQRLRRPGQSLTPAERDRAAAEARGQALDVAADLFERRACANCHTVSKVEGAEYPWQVEPVRLTQHFFVHAEFSHAAHDADPAACDSCHQARDSRSSTDLLIPDIENCRQCHGSGNARRNTSAQIPSTCVSCHGFHIETRDSYP